MSFLQKLDIVKLENEISYVVAEIYEENNIEYLMLIKAGENGEMLDDVTYGKVVILPTRKYGVETIEDPDLRVHLITKFFPMYTADYDNNNIVYE